MSERDDLQWFKGYFVGRRGKQVLIEFDDIKGGPCYLPASEVAIVLEQPGRFGRGEFGVPGWLVDKRITVRDAEAEARAKAADEADALERQRARMAAVEKARQRAERREQRRRAPGQMGFDL